MAIFSSIVLSDRALDWGMFVGLERRKSAVFKWNVYVEAGGGRSYDGLQVGCSSRYQSVE